MMNRALLSLAQSKTMWTNIFGVGLGIAAGIGIGFVLEIEDGIRQRALNMGLVPEPELLKR